MSCDIFVIKFENAEVATFKRSTFEEISDRMSPVASATSCDWNIPTAAARTFISMMATILWGRRSIIAAVMLFGRVSTNS
jgi:hypothetical protein